MCLCECMCVCLLWGEISLEKLLKIEIYIHVIIFEVLYTI